MKPLKCQNWSGRYPSLTPPARLTYVSRTIAVLLAMGLVGAAHSATNTVTSLADNGAGSLRQVIQNSVSGDTIIFNVTGTIILTNGELAITKNLTIRGPGASALAISGNYSSRVLNVSQFAHVFLSDLTICNGRTANGTINNPVSPGGGIYNAGTLVVSNCVISGNITGNYPIGAGYGRGGDGGGIYSLGTLIISGSILSGNSAGGGGTDADGGWGGGLYLGTGQCVLSDCVFSGNFAGNGGVGKSDSKYFGEPGGWGGSGGGLYGGGARIINCTFTNNQAGGGGDGGMGGAYSGAGGCGGSGGGVCVSSNLAMSGCTIVGNGAGSGGQSGASNFGGVAPGGNGGVGGGICAGERLLITNCTIFGNFGGTGGGATGIGRGGNGGDGGGIYSDFTNITIVACTIAGNGVGSGFTIGSGGGICSVSVGGPVLLNDIVAQNGDGGDIAGTFQTHGGNLIGTNPGLGPLADNGGPTWTMALLPGSPAIDAGLTIGAPATDQRGIPRPQGPGVDIGAFEFQYPEFAPVMIENGTNCRLQLVGLEPNQAFTVQASSNLVNWFAVTNFLAGTNRAFEFFDPVSCNVPSRFYRLKSGAP